MFGGFELIRHKEWVDATINFIIDKSIEASTIQTHPVYLRPLIVYWMPDRSEFKQHHAMAKRVIISINKGRKGLEPKLKEFLS